MPTVSHVGFLGANAWLCPNLLRNCWLSYRSNGRQGRLIGSLILYIRYWSALLDSPPFFLSSFLSFVLSFFVCFCFFGMSLCVLGMAEELKKQGIAVNALWPHTVIATAAITNVVGGEIALGHCRKADIMGDAAAAILSKDAETFSGNFCIDDLLLAAEGVKDFSSYRVDPEKELWSDFFVPADTPEVEALVMPMSLH